MDAKMDNQTMVDEVDRGSKRDYKPSGKPNYDKFDVEAEITKNFKFSLGMEFSSLQLFKDAVQVCNMLNGRKIKFAKTDRSRVRVVCRFNKKCGYVILVSRVKKTNMFRVKTLCPKHTCGTVILDIVGKETKEGLEQQQSKVFVDGEPLNQNQEDMLARNTIAEPNSATNLVATPNEKKWKKKVTRKLNLKKTRTSDRLRAFTVRRRVYNGPGNNAKSPIMIDDNDDDDATSPIVIDDDDDESYDPKVGSCMHALKNWNEMY